MIRFVSQKITLVSSVEESRTGSRKIGWQVHSTTKARINDNLEFVLGGEAGRGIYENC